MGDGDNEATVGAGLFTAKLNAAEVPPPGLGVLTAIATVLPSAMSVVVIWAWSCVELT